MQTTLVLLSVPDRVRGGVMGILSACIGTQPLGTLTIGLLAAGLGTPLTFILNAVAALVVIVPLAIPLVRDEPQPSVRWLLVALLPLLAAGPVSAQTAGPVPRRTYANEPLVFRDAGGAPQGIYVDLLEEIARKQGWTLRYVGGDLGRVPAAAAARRDRPARRHRLLGGADPAV